MSNYCKHGTYMGDWAGPDYICGDCEMGLCVHGNKTSGSSWEDIDGCPECRVPPRPRIHANLEASQAEAWLRTVVLSNPKDRGFNWLTTHGKMSAEEAAAHIVQVLSSNNYCWDHKVFYCRTCQ